MISIKLKLIHVKLKVWNDYEMSYIYLDILMSVLTSAKSSNLDAVKFYAFSLDRGMNKESCTSFKFPANY